MSGLLEFLLEGLEVIGARYLDDTLTALFLTFMILIGLTTVGGARIVRRVLRGR